jgi:branched-subunit amino acid aminotransferase/4-amino-4-deoxychorismate lyase
MGELTPVTQIDQTVINAAQPGPMCHRLSNLFTQLTRDPSQGYLIAG